VVLVKGHQRRKDLKEGRISRKESHINEGRISRRGGYQGREEGRISFLLSFPPFFQGTD
jgi:hypothetical protein